MAFKIGLALGMGMGYLAGSGKLGDASDELRRRWNEASASRSASDPLPTGVGSSVVVGPGITPLPDPLHV